MNKKIFITGGGGYVGSNLIPSLLKKGFKVTVLDLFIYGEDVLDEHTDLECIKGDIRDQELLKKSIQGHDLVIHLACISNDPSFELNPLLGRSINLDAFEPLVRISKSAGVKRFIYASSSSVYGVKNELDVNETMTLEPMTDYSKFKAECEKILSSYNSTNFVTTTIRPATVCGYARRQRLDVVVNIFTNIAFHKREISVFGGKQLRPNIHINDMIRVYQHFLENSIESGCYNAGFENISILKIAQMVSDKLDSEIIVSESNDPRSYRQNSDKLLKTGFVQKFGVNDAINDIISAYKNGKLTESDQCYTVKSMKKLNL